MYIIKNNSSTSIVYIEDLGISIPTSSQRDLEETFTVQVIADSLDLQTKITNGSLIFNNGISDLNVADAIGYVTEINQHHSTSPSSWITSGTAPSNPVNGQGWRDTATNILYIYDSTRTSWLSSPMVVYFARNGNTSGLYLDFGSTQNSDSGYYIPRNIVIVGVSAKIVSGLATKGFSLQVAYTNIFSFNLSNNLYANSATNIPINAGSILQVFCSATGNLVKSPLVSIEFCWRN